jgi:hypothetical protein
MAARKSLLSAPGSPPRLGVRGCSSGSWFGACQLPFGILYSFFLDLEGRMRKLLMIVLAVLLVGAIAAPAFAWEYEMKGEQEWRFRYFSRGGPNDLFGKSGNGFDIGFAGQNIYGHVAPNALATPQAATAPTAGAAAMRIVRGGFSFAGPDAYYNDSRLTLYPEIRVNPAIRTFGVYTIGGYRNKYRQWNDVAAGSEPTGVGVPPFERYYMHQTSPNAYDTAAVGSWEQFRFTVQSPWAIWSLGIKDFPFGTGASLANNVRAESFFTIVPYGPFRLMWAVWSAQNAINAGWGVAPDPDLKPTFFEALAMTYENADVSMGAQYLLQKLHVKKLYQDVQLIVGTPPPPPSAATGGYDRNLAQWIFFAKYNNGRFFANAEYAWVNMDKYFVGARPNFFELYHWFAEAGVMTGPSRLTFMAATASGPVLNNNNGTKVYTAYPINYQVMEPYEWLMFNTYGGGNQQFTGLLSTDDGHGLMGDAFCYATRLDYAVASNLNVWGSYIWAHRLEKNGVKFGGINSTGANATADQIALFAANAGRANAGGPNPYGYVTDGFIGYEVNAGVDWKLLENFTAYFRWAYWQPGEFFKEAYQARLPSTAGAPLDSQVLTSRDAIQAFQGSLMVNF